MSDSCNCDKSGHGCKGLSRPHQPTWCPVCDRNKMKRRCQSEGLYQEGDPLKELNWCCERGCDLLNRTTKFSQIKKTELDLNEKKFNFTGDVGMEGGDNYFSFNKKHNCKIYKEKNDVELVNNGHMQNSNYDICSDLDLKSQGINNYLYSSPDRLKQRDHLNSYKVRYHSSSGDYNDVMSAAKSLDMDNEKDNSNEMKNLYIREMEILRNNLSLLKDGLACDGKRMRQKSESEPGFSELSGGVPKRARDNSPKLKKTGRKLPMTPIGHSTIEQIPFQSPRRQSPSFATKGDEKVRILND